MPARACARACTCLPPQLLTEAGRGGAQYGDVIFQVPNHAMGGGDPSLHYTLVFNIFVMLQVPPRDTHTHTHLAAACRYEQVSD